MIRVTIGFVLSVLVAGGCAGAGVAGPPPRDPAVVAAAMDRAMIQIVRGTSELSEPDYQGRVKPALPTRLRQVGFTAAEADQILVRVDAARADRARMRRWWTSLWEGDQRHARR